MQPICTASRLLERRLTLAGMAAILLLGFGILSMVPPSSFPLGDCLFHSLTGHSCLTCGMTRSLHAMARGHWSASFRFHAFGPIVFSGIVFCFVAFCTEALTGRKLRTAVHPRVWRSILMVVAVGWLAYWVLRMMGE